MSLKDFLFNQVIQPVATVCLHVIAPLIVRFVPSSQAGNIFARYGVHYLPHHYYLPIPTEEDFECTQKRVSTLHGINLHLTAALQLTINLQKYFEELRHTIKADPRFFSMNNGTFMAGDSHIYYGLIRQYKPRNIIEIGSGNSTRIASLAGTANQHEFVNTSITAIEPYHADGIVDLTNIKIVRQKIQEIPFLKFTRLQANDILFIDSSHVLKPGGDVHYEYAEILPRLASGVLVHIHDVSLPEPYPKQYFHKHWFWTEQYILQMILAHSHRYDVLWPGNYLYQKKKSQLDKFFPEITAMRDVFPNAAPSSFWLRVK